MMIHLLAVGTTDSVYNKTKELSVKVLAQIQCGLYKLYRSRCLLLLKPKRVFILLEG